VTFELFGPGSATCTGTPVFTSTVAINANGTVTSAPYTPTTAGTYHWLASYGGDANNMAVTGACNDANETTDVAKATPGITTIASPDIGLGAGTLHDNATLTAEANPTSGNVTFQLFGPGNATCSGTPVFTSTVPINANGTVTSAPYTPTAVGTYHWVTAYGGDVNNMAVTGACNDANETTTVTKVAPGITANASPDIVLGGGTLHDTATVNGRVNPVPGATVDFRLYGPGNVTCSGTPVFESLNVTYPVGGGPVQSASFTPTEGGTYYWVVSYSGDANNASMTGTCNEANQSVTVRTTVAAAVTPPPPPAAKVAAPPPPPAPKRGLASINSAVTGCAGKPFRVNVASTGVSRVVFTLDGKQIASLKSKNRGNRFSVLIKPGKLKRGTHRVLAKITFMSSTQTRPKTLRVVFSRCARSAPQFTG
jgi:hypothetical protein